MRILIAVNDKAFSAYAVKEVAKIAMGTWADVRLLGVFSKAGNNEESRIIGGPPAKFLDTLKTYEKDFLDHFEQEGVELSPYAKNKSSRKLVMTGNGRYEDLYVLSGAMKNFSTCIRKGNLVKEIINESLEEESDLIVIGCPKGEKSNWPGGIAVPQKVVSESSCSVLVVKEEQKPEKIVCFFDQDNITQDSLEMIKQMITIYDVQLELVGLTDSGGLTEEVERNMNQVLKYYHSEHIKAWIRLVDAASLDEFISQAAQKDLIALWMNKKSLFQKFFPKQRVNTLINSAQSSVLILR